MGYRPLAGLSKKAETGDIRFIMQRRQFVSLTSGILAASAAPAFISSAAAQEVPGLNAKSVTIGCSAALSGPPISFGTVLQQGAGASFA